MIRIDALWLATTPIDMRMGTERLLARVASTKGPLPTY
jgi:transposase